MNTVVWFQIGGSHGVSSPERRLRDHRVPFLAGWHNLAAKWMRLRSEAMGGPVPTKSVPAAAHDLPPEKLPPIGWCFYHAEQLEKHGARAALDALWMRDALVLFYIDVPTVEAGDFIGRVLHLGGDALLWYNKRMGWEGNWFKADVERLLAEGADYLTAAMTPENRGHPQSQEFFESEHGRRAAWLRADPLRALEAIAHWEVGSSPPPIEQLCDAQHSADILSGRIVDLDRQVVLRGE